MIASVSWWWLLLFFVLSGAMAALLYYREKSLRDWKPWQKTVMAFIRFVFVFIIFLLLFAPLIKHSKSILEKPIIIIAQDNSASVLMNSDSVYYSGQYIQNLNNVEKRLSENFEVHRYNFGEFFRQDSIINYTDDATNMAEIFPEISAAYAGMNLGAIVIAGDGIFNLGENPLYLNKPQSSIYTIALGDTLPSKDVYIKDIQHNKAAFYKNKFPVRIVLAADKCKGETTKIEIHGINGKVYEKQVNIDSDNFITTIDAEIEASPKGLQEFKVVAKNIEGEISLDNNSRIFVVDIIDNRKNILFLSNGVHPDIGAIANALKDQPDYSITTKIISDASLKFENYELIVLHQIPSEKNVAPQLIQYLKQSKTPALYILGEQTALDAFNQIQTGLSISSLKSSYDEASPIINRNFNSFTVDEELKSILSSLPPLVVHFGDYKISAQAKLMMYQRINTVLTDKPLIMFIDESGIRNGIIVGEGIWRWRLHLYNITGTHELFDNLISRSIQYLVQTKIKHSLLVDTKRIYNTNEAVVLTAEFYDEAFDLRNQSELEIIVKDSLNKENKLRFVQKDDYYTLNLGSLSEGKYSYLASLNHDGKPHSAEGEFVVLDVSTEKLITKANHEFLYRLATENSGKMFYPNQLDALADVLEQDENIANRIYSQTKLSQLIELKYLFFIILLFASIEWFFRKFWGSY